MGNTQKYHPSTGQNCTPESYGAAGSGEPEAPEFGSMAGDDGYHDVEAQNAFAKKHGLPAVSTTPSNATGSIETSNPTAAEGATGAMKY